MNLVASLRDQIATQGRAPLTDPQIALWIAERRAPGAVCISTSTVALSDPLRPEVITAALDDTLREHPMLRASFAVSSPGEVQQAITDVDSVPWIDLSASGPTCATGVEAAALAFAAPMNLSTGQIMRAVGWRTLENGYRLTIETHHLAIDQRSWAFVVWPTVARRYNARVTGRNEPEPAQISSFFEYARQRLLQRSEQHYQERCENFVRGTLLNCVTAPSATRTIPSGNVVSDHGALGMRRGDFETACRSFGVFPSAVYAIAVGLVLACLEIEQVVMLRVSDRPLDHDALVGMYANALPLDLTPEPGCTLGQHRTTASKRMVSLMRNRDLALRDLEHMARMIHGHRVALSRPLSVTYTPSDDVGPQFAGVTWSVHEEDPERFVTGTDLRLFSEAGELMAKVSWQPGGGDSDVLGASFLRLIGPAMQLVLGPDGLPVAQLVDQLRQMADAATGSVR